MHPTDANARGRASPRTDPYVLLTLPQTHVHLLASSAEGKKTLALFSLSIFVSQGNISIRIAKWNNFYVFFLASLLGCVAELPMQTLFFFFP